ncbi:unnamed protein product [Anisakis simplex]|uniref:DUF4139 domain-containing protein n=1 Tax=Anisakis simplex TaxID=6269 RepID=A0A0M3K145_ANISI|nr:unnamed protein product [Anisakis simplex]
MKYFKKLKMLAEQQQKQQSLSHTVCLEARTLPTKSVIVYCDRAEVKRIVRCNLQEGRNEIIVKNVSSVIERQSLRVDGHGKAQILDVLYQEVSLDVNSDENDKIVELEDSKNELEAEKASLDDQLNILRKRVEVLDGVASQIGSNMSPSLNPSQSSSSSNTNQLTASPSNITNPTFVINENTIANLTNFLDFYGQTTGELKAEIRKKTREVDRLVQKIDRLEKRIDQMRCGFEYDSVKRNLSIIVETDVAEPSEFHVTYQVYCANWKPCYDLRVLSASHEQQTTSLTMSYFGVVEQHTGEDWRDAEIVLSTAIPSVGGSVPSLPTVAAGFQFKRGQTNASLRRKPNSTPSDDDLGFGSFDYNDLTDAGALQRLTAACGAQPNSDFDSSTITVIICQSLLAMLLCLLRDTLQKYDRCPSICFAIAYPATIPCDGSEQKLPITKLELNAKYIHETVPTRVAAAFLTVLATNTSTLPILAGPASVYLNNSFVSKMQLGCVLPGEEFCCSLGIDPSIKVEYKSAKVLNEQIGFVSKCVLQTHDQGVIVRNAKVNEEVELVVREHIPKAVDDKIKVSILSPDLRQSNVDAYLNVDNNLEWTVVLQPGEQRDLHIKWSIEYPINETVIYRKLSSTIYN